MLLAALADYCYSLQRRNILPRYGWVLALASYSIVIDHEGNIVRIANLKDKLEGERMKAHKERVHMNLPYRTKHSNGLTPFFLSDNSKYLMGLSDPSDKEKSKKKKDRAIDQFLSSKKYHMDLLESASGEHAKAVYSYFEKWTPVPFEKIDMDDKQKKEFCKAGNIVFQFSWDGSFAHEDEELISIWNKAFTQERAADSVGYGQCCVTGRENVPIERVHPPITGVRGANPQGAYLVSFGTLKADSAYSSFNKSQGENAPVAQEVAAAYGSALRYLFTNYTHHRIMDDYHFLFWANNDTQDEKLSNIFSLAVFGRQPSFFDSEEDETLTQLVTSIMRGDTEAIELSNEIIDYGAPFFILTILPHSARLGVVGFEKNSFGSVIDNIRKHYEDTKISVYRDEEDIETGFNLYDILFWLSKIKKDGELKDAKLPCKIKKDMLDAILTGTPYPSNVLQYAVHRIARDHEIVPNRIAIIKGCLLRQNKQYKECATVSLNPNCNEVPYLLGQLFWLYEITQRAAIPYIKRTLSEHSLVGAMNQPRVMFPNFDANFKHHIAKLMKNQKKIGFAISMEKKVSEIWNRLDPEIPLPIHQKDDAQGAFLMGYYHAKRDFYTKKDSSSAKAVLENETEE